jgi:hypothetical protein
MQGPLLGQPSGRRIMDAAALTFPCEFSYLARNDNNHDREFEPSGI